MKITFLGTGHGTPDAAYGCSAALLSCGGENFLIDAGDGTVQKMLQHGVAPWQLRAEFITHMHLDHTASLAEVLRLQLKMKKRRVPDFVESTVFLPQLQAKELLCRWIEMNAYSNTELLNFSEVSSGFQDDCLRMTPIPTRHLKEEFGGSCALLLEGDGKKVLWSGDLRQDFSDFPQEAADGSDLVVLELAHFPLEKALPVLWNLKTQRLIFQHLKSVYQSPLAQWEVQKLCSALPYPVFFAADGKTFDV